MRSAAADGHAPRGSLTVIYRRDEMTNYFWQTTDPGFCQGDGTTRGHSWACVWGPSLLPAGPTPTLKTVMGPDNMEGDDWLTVLVALGEEARSLTCGGVRIELTLVGTVSAADGERLAVYTYLAPWHAKGLLEAEVVRADGATTERITLNGPVHRGSLWGPEKDCDQVGTARRRE
ncbi:hypothetical protein F4556_007163 [Kitasatospora gansuensis]|uniref:Uncharacterized protein n=1 Tax=Kitasatospora gansuensis TaxID=258050 RepID=A0A7W7WLV8_9ACTN|nr:hypothetical protein [Kitasatospora gansuensis]MBB4951628.1 hypothetical protein [Kitasatospora gansuensis]